MNYRRCLMMPVFLTVFLTVVACSDPPPDDFGTDTDTSTESDTDSDSDQDTWPDDCARGATIFDRNKVATIDITLSDTDRAAMIEEAENSEESGSHAYPLKVDFNREVADQEYDGLSKLNLHPSTEEFVTIDEDLSYGAMRDFGIPTARTGWAKVTLNGEALGLYATVEQMNGDFLRCHYDNPSGDLYKPEEPEGNLYYLGSNWEDYSVVEHKWPEETYIY